MRGRPDESGVLFEVAGPFKVPVERLPGGRIVRRDLRHFWHQVGHLREARGCYVFAMQAGKGMSPVYVGRTRRSFERETFTDRHLARYYDPALLHQCGTPVMFFVHSPRRKGRVPARAIGQLEEFLIENAAARNPHLRNVNGTKPKSWGIVGVLRSRVGAPSGSARSFKRLMGM